MKSCAYCGSDNEDNATHCRSCGTAEFRVPAPPSPPQAQKVVRWFKIYSAALCSLYAALAVYSICGGFAVKEEDESGAWVFIATFPFFGACLLPLVLKPAPWLWTYDLVIICLGMTSACFLPVSIPLLIHWIKPETKAYFGKT